MKLKLTDAARADIHHGLAELALDDIAALTGHGMPTVKVEKALTGHVRQIAHLGDPEQVRMALWLLRLYAEDRQHVPGDCELCDIFGPEGRSLTTPEKERIVALIPA